MIDELLIERGIGETRAALIDQGRVVEVLIDRDDDTTRAGRIYLGRAVRIERALDAAFVEIGLALPGLLPAGEARALTEGGAVIVQVTRPPVDGKGARLTARPSLPGRFVAYRPFAEGVAVSRRIADAAERERLTGLIGDPGDGGVVVRTLAEGADGALLAAEAAALRADWQALAAAAARAKAPALLDADLGPVERVLRDHAPPALRRILFDDAGTLAAARAYAAGSAPDLAGRLALHDAAGPLFGAYGVDQEIEAALGPCVALPGGGALTIEPTTALVAIDVDSGAGVSGRDKAETALRTNLAAAVEIARQLRLRALGGNVVIDFIRMAGRGHADRVLAALRAALAADPAATQVAGFSALGLVEMTRQRTRRPLADLLTEPVAAERRPSLAALTSAALRRGLAEAAAGPPGRLRIHCAAALARALSGDPAAALGRRSGRAIEVVAEEAYERERFDIVIG